jgi:hypothetical protein
MKRAVLAATLAALAIAVPTALGAKQSSSATIGVAPTTLTLGSSITVSGHVKGNKASGAAVTLQAKPFGFSSFTNVASTTANSGGNYSVHYFPTRNTLVRVVAKTAPTATSSSVFVGVRMRVGLSVGTTRPKAGQKVRFSGVVVPAFNGSVVQLQRRTSTGHWNTMAFATLFATTSNGFGARSEYFRRLRISRSGTWRVRFVPPIDGWLANDSRTRTLIVH